LNSLRTGEKVGSSSRDIRLTGCFNFKGEAEASLKKTARLHVGLPLKALLDDAGGKAVLESTPAHTWAIRRSR